MSLPSTVLLTRSKAADSIHSKRPLSLITYLCTSRGRSATNRRYGRNLRSSRLTSVSWPMSLFSSLRTCYNLPTHGTIQYHPSLLPRHRGPSSINWPIIWGETQTGLTIFWPDHGLDTGPILLQKDVEILDTDTLGSLYFDRLYPLGVTALLEAVDLVRAGQAPRIVQDETQATYEGWCKAENVQIDWHKPLQEIWNLVRGADPQPGAWTTYHGAEFADLRCPKARWHHVRAARRSDGRQ